MARGRNDGRPGLWRANPGTIDRLLSERRWTQDKLAELSGVSEKTIYNLEDRGISRAKLVAIAEVFGMSPDSMAEQVTAATEMERFYSLVGLLPTTPAALADKEPYQDWLQERDEQVIQCLWAEAVGSSIQAEVLPKKAERSENEPVFLRVSFENVKDSYPGNVAIQPQGMRAVAAGGKSTLVFEARVVEEKPTDGKSSGIGIAVRVRDARLEQWQYKLNHDNYLLEDITKVAPDWQTFEVDLTAGSERWKKLTMGATVEGQAPDFCVITGIVFELGRRGRLRRPDKGRGVVDIGGIYLKDK